MTVPTGNLLYDSLSSNTGDIAIGIAAEQLFHARNLPTQIINPFEPEFPHPLIIGGGELIRATGDRFYDTYRQRGEHILNAAGVWTSANDLDYLSEYAMVSARSEREVEVLRAWVPEAEVVPCATTLLQSEHFDIPGLEPGETVVGIHVVPHALRLIEDLVPLIDAIPHKKVFIPFTHYNGDASFMKALPFNRTNSITLDTLRPLQLHSVIGQMSSVVVSSLHASIFAYSQNVPFASIHQQKAEYYFQDRGLRDHLVRDGRELVAMLERLNTERFDFSDRIAQDRTSINAAFDRYSAILGSAPSSAVFTPSLDTITPREQDSMLLDQAQRVIGDHDLALSFSETRRLSLKRDVGGLTEQLDATTAELRRVEAELDVSAQELHATRAVLEHVRTAAWRKAYRRGRRYLRSISAVFKRA
ncbi:polysaccharide pyruvyl transferase family protein [Cryobacterium melibiosiphilum]|uniref:Polysaccharide pyruvyl transferase family protein n=1 Tax=Cryobacterium melibiosiphilum TaxID=995039 RepID=A0A3A5MCE1_9MICO|nr:polysaccharide pyruvyl transferase family protein [Cryobacterium melibiosiphilum]RJT87797.1 polysaccharide pyruvyl transferase family protein [Cryobacterium melibiosiphilum]